MMMSCTKKENKFYKEVISYAHRNGTYVTIDIDSDVYKGKVITQNNRLFQYYYLLKGIKTQEEYESIVYDKLLNNESFNINDKKFIDEHLFMEYRHVSEVDSISKLGKSVFIDYFFNRNDGVKSNMWHKTQHTEAAIIKQLFDWELMCYNDCETGLLILGTPPRGFRREKK